MEIQAVLTVLTVIDISGSYLLSIDTINNVFKREIIQACRGHSVRKTGLITFMIIFPLIHEFFYTLLVPTILQGLGLYHDYSSALILCLFHVPVVGFLKHNHDTLCLGIYVVLFRLVAIGCHGFCECMVLHYFYNWLGMFWLYIWLRMDPRGPLLAPQPGPVGPTRSH